MAEASLEFRVEFISPHPKNFTDQVIDVTIRYPNICECIYFPDQLGSDKILASMRQGYTKQAYIELVDQMKASIKGWGLTSVFITGFCGEAR